MRPISLELIAEKHGISISGENGRSILNAMREACKGIGNTIKDEYGVHLVKSATFGIKMPNVEDIVDDVINNGII